MNARESQEILVGIALHVQMLEEQIRTAAGIDPEEQLSLSDVACIKQQLEAEKKFKHKPAMVNGNITIEKFRELICQNFISEQKKACHIAPDEEIDLKDILCIQEQIDAEQTID